MEVATPLAKISIVPPLETVVPLASPPAPTWAEPPPDTVMAIAAAPPLRVSVPPPAMLPLVIEPLFTARAVPLIDAL